MPNVLNTNFDYTYPGQLNTEIFIKPAVMHPDIQSLFRVISGIKYRRQLNLLNPLGKIVKGAQGCGTLVTTGDAVNITNRTLTVCDMELYLEQCADTFEQTIIDELTRSGEAHYDLIGTQLGSIIENLVVEALGREVFRIFSFGDTTSPAGDPAYYGVCDGLWTRLIDGTSSYDVTGVDTSITTLNQTTNTRAIDYFQNLWEGADIILKQVPNNQKRFFVTGNVWENYLKNLESIEEGNGGFTARTEDGTMTAFYRGIPVIPIYAWDNWISSDNLGNNTRILYTQTSNHVIGVEDASNQGSVRFWFDPNTNLNKIFGRFKLGYNYVHGGLTAISYGDV